MGATTLHVCKYLENDQLSRVLQIITNIPQIVNYSYMSQICVVSFYKEKNVFVIYCGMKKTHSFLTPKVPKNLPFLFLMKFVILELTS